MEGQTQVLTNTQLEILKAFRHDLNDVELAKLRKTLALFFAEIAMDEADKVWEKEGWNDEKIEELLNTKLRKRN